MRNSIRIVVAETNELTCLGISTMLKEQPDMVLLGQAKTKEGIICKCQDKPDLLLMAQNIPCASLPTLIKELGEGYPSIKILILTACQEMSFVRATLMAGASGYVLSDKSITDVLSAIRAVASGEEWLSPSLGPKLLIKGLSDTSSEASSNRSTTLTEQRLIILRLIGAGKNNKEIAAMMQIGRRTVSYHVSEICRTLKVNSRAEAIRIAIEMNLL